MIMVLLTYHKTPAPAGLTQRSKTKMFCVIMTLGGQMIWLSAHEDSADAYEEMNARRDELQPGECIMVVMASGFYQAPDVA